MMLSHQTPCIQITRRSSVMVGVIDMIFLGLQRDRAQGGGSFMTKKAVREQYIVGNADLAKIDRNSLRFLFATSEVGICILFRGVSLWPAE